MQQQINMNQFVGLCFLGFLATSLACQEGWQSYNGHCYKLFPTASRGEAADTCAANGAYLACIQDNAENQFVSGVANNGRAFLGHTDEGSEGIWRCSQRDSISPVWWRGEPNNCCGGENCAEINFGGNAYWNDVGCGARFPSLCEKDGPCTGDWIEHEGRCYRKVDSSLNFDEAESNCDRAYGAHLVCIDSAEENEFVAALFQGRRAWTGHTDRNHEGVWMCTGEDGNSAPSHWRARSNEPNNCCGGEHCAEINFGESENWNDLNCGGRLPYVCEKQDVQEETALMNCNEGWELHNGKCYKLFTTAATYDAAMSQCNDHGAKIVCIDNAEENSYIAGFTNGRRSFIGDVDRTSEGIWHCDTHNAEMGEIWWRNEPNNCCGGENCAEINFGRRGGWNDNNCNARLGFVCEKSGPVCDNGWSENDGNCYQYSSLGKTWSEAKVFCQTLGGHLACIGSGDEDNFVAEISGGRRAWIGHTDEGHEGAWMCTGENGNVSPWWTNEPNDWGSGEDCAEINFHQSGRWNDIRCSASFPFVCEKPAYAPVQPCDFVTNFFSKCVTESRNECANLVTEMAGLENGCDDTREFLAGMTGQCAVQNIN